MKSFDRGTVVVITRNRRTRLLQTLRGLVNLPERWPIIVVDNGSTDGTAKAVGREFPGVLLIHSRRNIGTAARNIAVAYAHTPYVAFCSDDAVWQPGALHEAARVMDANPGVGVVSACMLEGEHARPNPRCAAMAACPLDRGNLPGPQLLGFMADACVMRTRAFYDAGGFWPPLFTGGEETLLALDMAERGWRMVYMEDVQARRLADCLISPPASKRRRETRNAIWIAWMRLPWRQACKETLTQLRKAARYRQLEPVLMSTLAGMLAALRQRRVMPPDVLAMWELLCSLPDEDHLAAAGRARSSQGSLI